MAADTGTGYPFETIVEGYFAGPGAQRTRFFFKGSARVTTYLPAVNHGTGGSFDMFDQCYFKIDSDSVSLLVAVKTADSRITAGGSLP